MTISLLYLFLVLSWWQQGARGEAFPRAEMEEMVSRWLAANAATEKAGNWSELPNFYTEDAVYSWYVKLHDCLLFCFLALFVLVDLVYYTILFLNSRRCFVLLADLQEHGSVS